MRLTLALPLLAALVLAPVATLADDSSPEGYWKTINDEGTRPMSVVKLWVEDGKLKGKIVKLYRLEGEEPEPKCDKCKGKLKDQPVIGLQIVAGLEKDGDEWSGGTIMDPDNGKYYKCLIEVQDGGKTLKVRGYIGFSLIGRTQKWERTTEPPDKTEFIKG